MFVRSLPRRNENYVLTILYMSYPPSEAYLEGMKTTINLAVTVSDKSPKPTSKEWKRI